MAETLVLYDKDCYLCTQTKKILRFLDWFQQLEWRSLQKYELTHILTPQEKEAIRGAVHIIKKDGSRLTGFQAVRYMLLRTPLTATLGLLLSLPGMDLIGVPVYQWVAKNRYKMFKHKCSSGACKIY